MPRADLTARYVLLAKELGDKYERAHGWRKRVAQQLGIDESTLSKILKGERAVGIELAERAIERLKLDRSYFWGDSQRGAQRPGARVPLGDDEVQRLVEKFDS